MMPSQEVLYLITDESRETMAIEDFLKGLNRRILEERKLADAIKRLQPICQTGITVKSIETNQKNVVQSYLPRSCRLQKLESVFEWEKETALHSLFK